MVTQINRAQTGYQEIGGRMDRQTDGPTTIYSSIVLYLYLVNTGENCRKNHTRF